MIDDIINVINQLTSDFVKAGFEAIRDHWVSSGLLLSVLTLYVIYFLYQAKYDKACYTETAMHLMKVLVVFMLSFNWDVFHLLIYRTFTDYPISIGELLTSNIKDTYFAGGAGGLSLGHLYDRGMDIAFTILSSGGYSISAALTAFLGFFLVFISTIFITITALAILIISKFLLATTLVIAPYFMWMYLFQGTRGLSESWLKLSLNSALVPLFLTVFVSFVLIMADLILVHVEPSTEGLVGSTTSKAPSFPGIAGYFCVSILGAGFILKSREMASSLSASLTQVGGSFIAAKAQQGAQATKSVLQDAKKRGSRVSNTWQNKQSNLLQDVKNRAAERQKESDILNAATKRRGG